ncbi:hypothetical protein [Haloarcula sp. 1CSR25-25]|uniref:hypothetical protein n=1 Tax=Haloarcula sp. 1CSR25-25 TaxID=2862545 RepID=UPI002894BB72|nr:hypothetical protein [Haloarcula sp. 1CSR25-25]MDT3437796.1 hypothetical protein [Haloarcula sp. 1CSR25-25]
MSYDVKPSKGAGIRAFYKVTPSTASEGTSDIDKHLTSLADLEKTVEKSGLGRVITDAVPGLQTPTKKESVKFEFISLSKGENEPVELYYSADGKQDTLRRRLKSVYPSSFDIEKVHLDLGHNLIEPIPLSIDEFKDRLKADQLYRNKEEYFDFIQRHGEIESGETPPTVTALDAATAINLDEALGHNGDETESGDDAEGDTNNEGVYEKQKKGLPWFDRKNTNDLEEHFDIDDEDSTKEPTSFVHSVDTIEASPSSAESDSEANRESRDPFSAMETDSSEPDTKPDDEQQTTDSGGGLSGEAEGEGPSGDISPDGGATSSVNSTDTSPKTSSDSPEDSESGTEADGNTDEVEEAVSASSEEREPNEGFSFGESDEEQSHDEDEDERVVYEDGDTTYPLRIVIEDEYLTGVVKLNHPDTIPENEPLVTLDGPTMNKNGEILVRPSVEYTEPNATRWYGQEETTKDWMTTLDTATESNPEYDSENHDEEIDSPEALQTLFTHLEEAADPTAYQVVFEAKPDWDKQAQRRKKNIRSGEFDEPWLEKYVLGGTSTDEDRDLKAYEYRRIKLIENKRPRETFDINIRAISLAPKEDFSNDASDPTEPPGEKQDRIRETMQSLTPLLDPLDGVYYGIKGEVAAKGDNGMSINPTADEVVTNFFERNIVRTEDRRGAFTSLNLWNDPKQHPEIVVNGRELGELIIIPSGEDMDSDVFRSTGTRDKDIEPLRRPRPEIHKGFSDGMALGYAYDENGIPEDDPTCLPEEKLTNHWALFGASGSGKTVNTISMLLSAHANTSGPTILVDPKQGNMVENYCKSHLARFGNIRDVKVFNVPETLPAIPFFDIRPHLHEGMNRDDAIQQKVDEFHMVMEMIDSNYSTAYVAKTVLGALIKARFDAKYGDSHYTLDDLYSLAVDLYANQNLPRVSHQPQVEHILSNQLHNSEQDFKNTMQAVINRLDDLQEDINLYRLFNQNPEWDDENGTYKFNRMTPEKYERAEESDNVDIEDVDLPKSALDFREFLDTDTVFLFDTGNFVRDESQQAFSMYILSALWGAVRARYNDRDSHETIDHTVKVVIDESAPIVSTELVTNTLIPEGREFGLSLGMIMQFPGQVANQGVEGSFDELKNNVQSKIYGHIDPNRSIADSLIHGKKDASAIKNKIRRLRGGEWIVDLPEPEFGVDVPPPFSLKSLEIPEGHPEGDSPFNDSERELFYERYSTRKSGTQNRYGFTRPDPEDLDDDGEVTELNTGSDIDSDDSEPEEPEESEASTPDAGTEDADSKSGFTDGIFGETSTNGDAIASTESGPVSQSDTAPTDASAQSERVADSSSNTGAEASETSSNTNGSEDSDPLFEDIAPFPATEINDILSSNDMTSPDGVQTAAFDVESKYGADTEEFHRALVTLSNQAEAYGTHVTPAELWEAFKHSGGRNTDSGTQPTDVSDVDDPQEESSVNANDFTDHSKLASSKSDSDNEESTSEPETEDETTMNQESAEADSTVEQPVSESGEDDTSSKDADSSEGLDTDLNISDEVAKKANEAVEEIEPEPDSQDHKQSPADVSLETPVRKNGSLLSREEREDLGLSRDDVEFMALVADAFRDELEGYELTETMKNFDDRAGEPDLEKLQDEGYIDPATVLRQKYYSLTRDGWRLINNGVPGNKFGDHMEKIGHRVGVFLLSRALSELPGVTISEYEEHDGETYDVIGYNKDGSIHLVGEVETQSNNKTAVVDDYQKLAAAPGEAVWAFPSHSTLEEVWNTLVDQEMVDPASGRVDRAQFLQDWLDENPEDGIHKVRSYSQLKDSVTGGN